MQMLSLSSLFLIRLCITGMAMIILFSGLSQTGSALAANGSVIYTYDALGRISTASYDTNVFVYYTYDANGNRTGQVVNVNTLHLCLGSSAHGNPTTWGAGLWATAAAGC